MRRVKKLAFDSTESVDSALSPALLLVYNKCSLDEELDISMCTEKFFQNIENEEIKKLYSEVHCISIPHFDQVKKIKKENQTIIIDGEEIFHFQILRLFVFILFLLLFFVFIHI